MIVALTRDLQLLRELLSGTRKKGRPEGLNPSGHPFFNIPLGELLRV
ncbi:hypothetical protein POTG_04362 [Paenibacillus sp. oral taxon 786 str. D14]|nr:hypothetical protein POTG_04362 [Paenibacillus sp. oral taxon 786 str. D14]